MSRLMTAIGLAVALATAPASAATWAFGGSAGTATSFATTVANVPTQTGTANITFTAVARRFTPLPSGLTNISQLISTTTPGNVAQRVDRTASSIGAVGGANTQLDTNNANQYEAIYFTIDNLVRLNGVTLSFVDANDTLQIYGVDKASGALTSLGYGGRITSGLGGAASVVNTGANSGTSALTFTNTMMNYFSGYVFTTRAAGNVLTDGDLGQGYRIDAILGDALPEPSSWALMIVGFGLTGVAMRRRAVQIHRTPA